MIVSIGSVEELRREVFNKKSEAYFRGESSEYDLLPSALREGNIKRFHSPNVNIEQVQEFEQIAAEYNAIIKFANTQRPEFLRFGNPIPYIQSIANEEERYERLKTFQQKSTPTWLNGKIGKLATTAQHHEILTRLLDWTIDFDTAVYFACAGALHKTMKKLKARDNSWEKDCMAIWMLNHEKLETFMLPFEIINPRITNRNAAAQNAILSSWIKHAPYDGLVDTRPLNKLFEEYDASPLLTKFIIPYTDCAKALTDLHKQKLTAQILFPSWHGRTEHVNDQIALENFAKATR